LRCGFVLVAGLRSGPEGGAGKRGDWRSLVLRRGDAVAVGGLPEPDPVCRRRFLRWWCDVRGRVDQLLLGDGEFVELDEAARVAGAECGDGGDAAVDVLGAGVGGEGGGVRVDLVARKVSCWLGLAFRTAIMGRGFGSSVSIWRLP
jgi:hypothetical protein